MDKLFDDFEKSVFRNGDTAWGGQVDLHDDGNDLREDVRLETNDASDIVRKSMERFLIGNVL